MNLVEIQSLQALLNGVEYTPGAAKLLCGKISETSVQQLAQLKLPFKFLGEFFARVSARTGVISSSNFRVSLTLWHSHGKYF